MSWVQSLIAGGVCINITTREGHELLVELTLRGYQVVGNAHNVRSPEQTESRVFESLHALLDHTSLSYRMAFVASITAKLQPLATEQMISELADATLAEQARP